MSGAKVTLSPDVQSAFFGASSAIKTAPLVKKQRNKRPPPLSIRVTDEERAILSRDAAGRSVNGYIREKLFGPDVVRRRVRKAPSVDQEALGRVLGALGRSRLSSNLNQIAKAANMGALPVTPELKKELREACADIRTMRTALIQALGIKPE